MRAVEIIELVLENEFKSVLLFSVSYNNNNNYCTRVPA